MSAGATIPAFRLQQEGEGRKSASADDGFLKVIENKKGRNSS
jgi:hypothetical protein